jgi:hypothetical protein
MGKFIIKKTSNDGFVFNLLANNNEVIGTSQTYKSLASAKSGIESVKKNAESEIEDQTLKDFEAKKNPKYEIYQDKAGEYRFRLKAANGEIILTSEGYKAKSSAKNGIDSIQRNADSEIVDQTK